jgi:hypothetical protein
MSKVISTSGLTALRILIRNNSEDIFNRWSQNKITSEETVRLLDLEN